MEHKYIPLYYVKDMLIHDFEKWCDDASDGNPDSLRDFIEYLIQCKYIQGKPFLKFIDDAHYTFTITGGSIINRCHDPLTSGFLIPTVMIGPLTPNKAE